MVVNLGNQIFWFRLRTNCGLKRGDSPKDEKWESWFNHEWYLFSWQVTKVPCWLLNLHPEDSAVKAPQQASDTIRESFSLIFSGTLKMLVGNGDGEMEDRGRASRCGVEVCYTTQTHISPCCSSKISGRIFTPMLWVNPQTWQKGIFLFAVLNWNVVSVLWWPGDLSRVYSLPLPHVSWRQAPVGTMQVR